MWAELGLMYSAMIRDCPHYNIQTNNYSKSAQGKKGDSEREMLREMCFTLNDTIQLCAEILCLVCYIKRKNKYINNNTNITTATTTTNNNN